MVTILIKIIDYWKFSSIFHYNIVVIIVSEKKHYSSKTTNSFPLTQKIPIRVNMVCLFLRPLVILPIINYGKDKIKKKKNGETESSMPFIAIYQPPIQGV